MVQKTVIFLALVSLAGACGPGEEPITDDDAGTDMGVDMSPDASDAGDAGDDSDTDVSDTGDEDASDGLAFTAGPTVEVAPNEHTPLVARLIFSTSEETSASVTLDDGELSRTLAFAGAAVEHEHTLLELNPGTSYTLTVEASTDAGDTVTSDPVMFETAALPDGFPALSVTADDPSAMEPGYTYIAVPKLDRADGGHLILLDPEGEVVWYHDSPERVTDTRQMEDGNIVIAYGGRTRGAVMDIEGNFLHRWHTRRHDGDPQDSNLLDTDALHHELFPGPGERFTALSVEVREIDGYPTSETDFTARTESVQVAGDVVFEFESDGTITGSWPLLDVLDPTRIAYDSFGGYWNGFYPEYDETFDWAHANSVIVDPLDDNLIVSLRHQDAIVKFDRNGDVIWILGPHANWDAPFTDKLLTPVGADFRWHYHPHAPTRTPDGNILLFDNGVHRASPPDPKVTDTHSRAVEYSVDPNTMEIEEVWEWDGAEADLYCRIVGDADFLPESGNVLVTCGATEPTDEDVPSAHILEVTHDADPQVVFELTVDDDNPDGAASRVVYRAERIPSLYPAGILAE